MLSKVISWEMIKESVLKFSMREQIGLKMMEEQMKLKYEQEK